jgi:spore germination protein YaaH
LILLSGLSAQAEFSGFSDVPPDSWAGDYIAEAAALGIMNGPGDGTFGYGRLMSRAEFATMLPRLFRWSMITPDTPTFLDNADMSQWYYDDIETAVTNGAVTADSALFRPNDPITREEMAVMLVRALGYGPLSDSLKNVRTPFTDVKGNLACIAMAYDFGIIRGSAPTTFNPKGSASREEAATMMVRLYKSYYSKINWTHAFYALSSYGQKDMIPVFDAVSFGWSRLEADTNGMPVLNTTSSGGNSFRIPTDYQEVVELSKNSGVSNNLNVFMSTSQKVTLTDGTVTDACAAILNNPENRAQAVAQIIAELQRENSYSGVTIDFEEMRGAQLRDSFSLFLQALRDETLKLGLTLYVCVPPVTSDGQYFDGYDYKIIGEYADKVILMAHDYAAKTLTTSEMNAGFTETPVTPIYEIYTALQAITDAGTGVQDKSKIALAISFNSIQWKLQAGKVTRPAAYQPEPSAIYARMLDPAAVLNYSAGYQNPYITYFNDTDNTENIGWYEDTRSISAKMDLARMFGVTGISVWRLGIIPAYADTTERPLYYDLPAWLAGQK